MGCGEPPGPGDERSEKARRFTGRFFTSMPSLQLLRAFNIVMPQLPRCLGSGVALYTLNIFTTYFSPFVAERAIY